MLVGRSHKGISASISCGETPTITSNSTSITLGGILNVRETITCYGGYTINQDDVNALGVSSTASVAAKDLSGNSVNTLGTTVVSLDQVG